MDSEKIKNLFENRAIKEIGRYKKTSVVILLYEEKGDFYIILEKRALNLSHQPGDICLPGGHIEDGETPLEGAIRETIEELCIKKDDLDVYAPMDYLITPFSVVMYPFVASLKNLTTEYNRDEVDSLIKVPLKFLLENEPLYHKGRLTVERGEKFPYHLIKGGKSYKFSDCEYLTYFYVWENNVIWGHTARIIYEFVNIIKENKPT